MKRGLIVVLVICLLTFLPLSTLGQRIQPEDLSYLGAFRLPDAFNWGARGMTFFPEGNGGAGTLLVTGFEALSDPGHPQEACWDPAWNCYAYYGEVAIPAPAVEADWQNLPEASLAGGMINFDGGLASEVHREYLFVSDIAYVPARGTQTADKVYGSIELWYAEGVAGEDSFPTIWMANRDGTSPLGMFHVGPWATPYHGRKMGSYLFTVPQWYADQYLGGRTLMTGRSRGTPAGSEAVTIEGGSQGPALFAFHPFSTDDPAGNLDALPVLYYRVKYPGCAGPNVGDPAQCDYPEFTMCDDWTGGAFVGYGTRQAIMLLGWKGLGGSCYDQPPPDPVVCDDPCSDGHGYHCYPNERQVIFYDVDALGANVSSAEPWTVSPYTIWRPQEFYLKGYTCWNAGGMAFDESTGRLYMVERGLGEGEINAVVVHVWQVRGSDPTTFSLTMGTSPAGGGTTAPSEGIHQIVSPQAITATAADGYRFVNWTATEGIVIANPHSSTTAAVVTGNGSITANFTLLADVVNLLFIHHSCGQNWLDNHLREALDAKPYIDEVNDIYYSDDVSPDTGRPDSLGPTPGDHTDMSDWLYWFNDYLGGMATFDCATGTNRIIMFKSCYPNSHVTAEGTLPADPFDDSHTVTNHQAVFRNAAGSGTAYTRNGYNYYALEDIFEANPHILFIPVTAPPECQADATPATGANTRAFSDWLKKTWLPMYQSRTGLNNVAIFDWFDILAAADMGDTYANMLKTEYGGDSGNSHPNGTANAYLTVIFASGTPNFIDPVYARYTGASVRYSLTTASSPSYGGATIPAAGTNDQYAPVVISATANANCSFTNWAVSSNALVYNRTSPVTTLLMGGETTVTANFTGSTLSPCPECKGDPVELANVEFGSTTSCECRAATAINIGPGVIIQSGATVIFTAPTVNIRSGFRAREGGLLRIRQE